MFPDLVADKTTYGVWRREFQNLPMAILMHPAEAPGIIQIILSAPRFIHNTVSVIANKEPGLPFHPLGSRSRDPADYYLLEPSPSSCFGHATIGPPVPFLEASLAASRNRNTISALFIGQPADNLQNPGRSQRRE